MFEIAKRTGIGALILMIIPLGVWASGWQWQPGQQQSGLLFLFWMTETVTSPWGAMTSVLLLGWFVWCLRYRLRPALGLGVILILSLIVGQGLKTVIKDQVQESRPFVLWMEHNYSIDDKAFYALPRKARSALVGKELENQQQIPGWLRRHWQVETGFSFPSGHTVFASSWALLALGLLWPRRHRISTVVIMAWATTVMISRMLLGMHWPRDLVMGTLLSWLVIVLAVWAVQRWIGPLTPRADEAEDIHRRE